MGETTLPNIQYTGLRDCCCAQTLQPSDDANPCSWQNPLLANINDDEDCFVGQAPHIAGLCHRSHKQGVCDPGPGRGDPPKPLLAVTLIMQSGVFQSNACARLSTAARPPLCSGCGSCQSLVRRITPRFMEELLRAATEQYSTTCSRSAEP